MANPGPNVSEFAALGIIQPSAAQPQVSEYAAIGILQPTAAQPRVAQFAIIGIISNPKFAQVLNAFGLPCWSPCRNVIYSKGEIG